MGVMGNAGKKEIFIGNRKLMEDHRIADAPVDPYREILQEHEYAGDTVVYMGWGGKIRAFFVVSDVVRDEAAGVIEELKRMNCAVSLVSGDNSMTTSALAEKVGIEQVVAEATPVQKKELVSSIQEKGTG